MEVSCWDCNTSTASATKDHQLSCTSITDPIGANLVKDFSTGVNHNPVEQVMVDKNPHTKCQNNGASITAKEDNSKTQVEDKAYAEKQV